MLQPSTLLRVAWSPRGGVALTEAWWPSDARAMSPPLAPIDDRVQFGAGVTLSRRDSAVEATWRDSRWPPALATSRLTVTVTPSSIRITVPAVWRAYIHLGWRAGHLLISSDLRTVAAALSSVEPAPYGVAAFLAHGGRAGPGVLPSLYQGVCTVKPGHSVTVEPDRQPRWERTWAPERDEGFAAQPLEVVVHRLRDHLDGLAEQILGRHDRVACLFSGGLDSSLVAATLLRRAPERVVLFNVGSALGTAAEVALRARFLNDFGAVSHPVELPAHTGLVHSLRATNAASELPNGSPFTHVFEEIIAAASERGCDAVVTGDGGDEVFAEREELLVDLLARRSHTLPAAVGHFALRNGERGTQTLRRALRRLRTLNGGARWLDDPAPGDVLLGEQLARHVAAARLAAGDHVRQLWADGWTCSGIGSYHRAAAVPEWEPVSADAADFPVISPLVDEAIVSDALALHRAAMVARVPGGQPKWLLRQAALHWLPPPVALHPKIGSADGQILAAVRANEHRDLLELLSSGTAQRAGLRVPAAMEDADAPLWFGDAWIRAAALVAWLDRVIPAPARRPIVTLTPAEPAPLPPSLAHTSSPPKRARRARWRVAVLAVLNVAAQLTSTTTADSGRSAVSPPPDTASGTVLRNELIDLARRACAAPFVSGSSWAMSRALAWYLRLGGKRAVVIRGTAQGELRTRYWVEVDNLVVDVSGTETPLVPDTDR